MYTRDLDKYLNDDITFKLHYHNLPQKNTFLISNQDFMKKYVVLQ